MMKHFGLVGFPLSHSFSKRFFTNYFAERNIEAQYLNFELKELNSLPEILKEDPLLIGFNVTIPYKEAIIPFLDQCDPNATAIRAVNTVKIDRSGDQPRLVGYNTDLIGFRKSLLPLLKPHHKKALVLGTGGASKAIVAALNQLSIPNRLVSREAKSEMDLCYSQLSKELMEEFTILVNTTPLGTYPNTATFPDIPYQYLSDRHLLFDLVYNPEVTQFLQMGAHQGASIKNGQEMLELQALAAWEIWGKE